MVEDHEECFAAGIGEFSFRGLVERRRGCGGF